MGFSNNEHRPWSVSPRPILISFQQKYKLEKTVKFLFFSIHESIFVICRAELIFCLQKICHDMHVPHASVFNSV